MFNNINKYGVSTREKGRKFHSYAHWQFIGFAKALLTSGLHKTIFYNK